MFKFLDKLVNFIIHMFSSKKKAYEYDEDNDTEVDWTDFDAYVKQAEEEKAYKERVKKLREKNGHSGDTISAVTVEAKTKYTSLDFIENQEKKHKLKENNLTKNTIDKKTMNTTTRSGQSLKTVKISKNLETEVDTHIKKEINKYQTVPLEKLSLRIESNLKMLDDLILELKEYDQEYHAYIMKLEDLKYQSEGNKKILMKLKKEAPYYGSTIRAIINHTGIVSELMDFA